MCETDEVKKLRTQDFLRQSGLVKTDAGDSEMDSVVYTMLHLAGVNGINYSIFFDNFVAKPGSHFYSKYQVYQDETSKLVHMVNRLSLKPEDEKPWSPPGLTARVASPMNTITGESELGDDFDFKDMRFSPLPTPSPSPTPVRHLRRSISHTDSMGHRNKPPIFAKDYRKTTLTRR